MSNGPGLPDHVRYRKVRKCSACGRTHYMIFIRMEQVEMVKGVECSFSGRCPNSGVTVYLRDEESHVAAD
jgi:Zn ribbon nucleic-acid-binding protein